jgi:hypothetical protein
MDMAIKRVGPDTVEGLAIPYGVDVDGEQFDAETDLCLDWFGKSGRPVIYDHGLDEKGPSVTVIGRQIEYEERPDGKWAQAQLDRNQRYRKAVDRLVEEGALGFSSGSMGHLARVDRKSGRITRWPWIELSLTPIPAHLGAQVHYAKSADLFRHLEDAEVDLTSFLKSALGAVLEDDRDGAPGTESLDDKAGRVAAAVDEFRDHARSSAEMRAKAGRVLSAANRDRIAKALASKDAVLGAYADLEALLAETDPQQADAAKSALALEAALAEVAMNRYAVRS